VTAYEEAIAAGRGSIELDGKMIDVPVVARAQQLLARHAAIEARAKRNVAR
jgi:citrate lyase subunit beta/citryl-CoA lyase